MTIPHIKVTDTMLNKYIIDAVQAVMRKKEEKSNGQK